MDSTKPARLAGTKVFLAGTKGDPKQAGSRVNLADPKTIQWMKKEGITKVFCVYPVTKKQFESLAKRERSGLPSLEHFQKIMGIEPNLQKKLKEAGIATSSLVRKPKHIKGNQKFALEAARTRGNFLIQCSAGRQVSAAYAIFYLATATPMSLKEIRETFIKSGRKNDLPRIEEILQEAGVKLKEIIAKKEAKKTIRTRRRRANARREELATRKGRRKL